MTIDSGLHAKTRKLGLYDHFQTMLSSQISPGLGPVLDKVTDDKYSNTLEQAEHDLERFIRNPFKQSSLPGPPPVPGPSPIREDPASQTALFSVLERRKSRSGRDSRGFNLGRATVLRPTLFQRLGG